MARILKVLSAGIFLTLAACAAPPKLTPQEMAEAQTPLTCSTKAECDLYWQKAQIWLVNNSAYRVQSATDTVISTYGPINGQPNFAFTITKLPNGNGGALITLQGACGNMFGCIPPLEGFVLNFRRYVVGENLSYKLRTNSDPSPVVK